MPLGDMTGPMGQGPMTGRGLGYGGGYDAPGYMYGRPRRQKRRLRGRRKRRYPEFWNARGGGQAYPLDTDTRRNLL